MDVLCMVSVPAKSESLRLGGLGWWMCLSMSSTRAKPFRSIMALQGGMSTTA